MLGDHKADFRDLDGMAKFVSSVAWISADKDTSGSDDRKNNERVADGVEAMDTNCVALLQTCIVKTSDQATDCVLRRSVGEVD